MTHYEKLEFRIKTGNDQQANAGSDSRVFCGIGGREFRLERPGLSEFGRNSNEVIIAGNPGANIDNPAENDPGNPTGELENLPGVLSPGGTKPQPVYIRYEPKDQQKGWQLEDATVKVFQPPGGSGFPPGGSYGTRLLAVLIQIVGWGTNSERLLV